MLPALLRNLLLVDGLGALASAAGLGLVLPWLGVGLPDAILTRLALCAVAFATWSLTGYASGRRGGAWLAAIATANALYCVATIAILWAHASTLTWLGAAYFTGELLIVAPLAAVEWRVARGG